MAKKSKDLHTFSGGFVKGWIKKLRNGPEPPRMSGGPPIQQSKGEVSFSNILPYDGKPVEGSSVSFGSSINSLKQF